MISNSNLLFQGVIFQCHVSFREGIITSKCTTSGFQWSVQTFGRWQQQAVLKPCKQQTRLPPHEIQTSWQNPAPKNPPTKSVLLTKYLQKVTFSMIGWSWSFFTINRLVEGTGVACSCFVGKNGQNHKRWEVFQNSGTQMYPDCWGVYHQLCTAHILFGRCTTILDNPHALQAPRSTESPPHRNRPRKQTKQRKIEKSQHLGCEIFNDSWPVTEIIIRWHIGSYPFPHSGFHEG